MHLIELRLSNHFTMNHTRELFVNIISLRLLDEPINVLKKLPY
jgi:hypothetical protein